MEESVPGERLALCAGVPAASIAPRPIPLETSLCLAFFGDARAGGWSCSLETMEASPAFISFPVLSGRACVSWFCCREASLWSGRTWAVVPGKPFLWLSEPHKGSCPVQHLLHVQVFKPLPHQHRFQGFGVGFGVAVGARGRCLHLQDAPLPRHQCWAAAGGPAGKTPFSHLQD